jgi:hypothetical protein
MGQPQNPSSPIGREYAQYNINNDEVLSFDEITSDTSWRAQRSLGKGRGRGKGRASNKGRDKNNANWDFDYSVIPKFGSVPGMVLYAFEDLTKPNLLYAVKPTRVFEKSQNPGSSIQMIDIPQIRMRSNFKAAIGASLVQEYYKAYNAMYLVNMSIENCLMIEEPTKQIMNLLHKRFVGVTRGHNPDTHLLLDEIQKASLGDYWRVLRTRPPTSATKAHIPDVEYFSNNTYSYYEVKKTIGQKYPHIKERPSRFWNETPAKEIADELLYSLSGYWPGMPIQTDIVCDSSSLGLPVYKNLEATFGPADMVTGKIQLTLQRQFKDWLNFGQSPMRPSKEDFMMKVQSMDEKYALYARNWPFLVTQRLLKMQMSRLRIIKTALTEKLNNHPLSSTNSASFFNDSNASSGIDSAAAGFMPQSRGADGNPSQSATRAGSDNLGGRGQ